MTHPAIRKAQEVYSECPFEDLEPNQEALVATVNRIGDRKAQAYRAAQKVFGDVPKMYRACLLRADEVANSELDAALAAYRDSLDYEDEVEAERFAVAAE